LCCFSFFLCLVIFVCSLVLSRGGCVSFWMAAFLLFFSALFCWGGGTFVVSKDLCLLVCAVLDSFPLQTNETYSPLWIHSLLRSCLVNGFFVW